MQLISADGDIIPRAGKVSLELGSIQSIQPFYGCKGSSNPLFGFPPASSTKFSP